MSENNWNGLPDRGRIHFSPDDTPDSEIYLRSKIPPEYIKEYTNILEDYRRDLYYIEKELNEAQIKCDADTAKALADYNERIAKMWLEIEREKEEGGEED